MSAEVLQDRIELYRFNEHGASYTAACVLVYSGGVVEIKGLDSPITTKDWKEISQHLKKQGVTSVKYCRRNGGRERLREFKL